MALLGFATPVVVVMLPDDRKPCNAVTVASLTKLPAAYAGKTWCLKTAGFEAGSARAELAFRKTASSPPAVVIRFKAGTADPRNPPKWVSGTVELIGGVVYVTDAVPSPGP